MKIGDTVTMSSKNPNHLYNGVCAYAGMTGKVIEIYEDNGFCLDCGTSKLVVPLAKKVVYGYISMIIYNIIVGVKGDQLLNKIYLIG